MHERLPFLSACLVLMAAAFHFSGCPESAYPFRNFLDLTDYKHPEWKQTAAGVRYWAPDVDDSLELQQSIDAQVEELSACLTHVNPRWEVRKDWFEVLVPEDWYCSYCTGEQLIPSAPPCQSCRDKGLSLADECCGLETPTELCPCVCNVRAIVQDNRVVVTTPNLKLLKAELTRLVTGVNNPWADADLLPCL